jgi:hypothetical protein
LGPTRAEASSEDASEVVGASVRGGPSEDDGGIAVTSAAVMLSLIAGTVITADSISALAFSSPSLSYGNSQFFGGLPYYYWFGPYIFGLGNHYWFFIFAVTNLVSGLAIATGAGMLYFRPGRAELWGAVILVFSVIGFIGIGDFFITQFLGVVGGAIGVGYGRHRRMTAPGGSAPILSP